MRNILKIATLITLISFIVACETYPDWKDYVEYDSTYPVSGEYIVNNYKINADNTIGDKLDKPGEYTLYIYNKADNQEDGKDSIWIDARIGVADKDYKYKYKIKALANMDDLSFNCDKSGNVQPSKTDPLATAPTITITESKVIDQSTDITNSEVDSIHFKVKYVNGSTTQEFMVAGHRKTGWEQPGYDDAM